MAAAGNPLQRLISLQKDDRGPPASGAAPGSLDRLRLDLIFGQPQGSDYLVAMTAISISTSRGKRETSTVARPGGAVLKYSP